MTTAQPPHDAQRILSDLRDHLARHDKPIAFFFGAGTSCAVRVKASEAEGDAKGTPLIPAVAELTSRCRSAAEEMGDEYAQGWASIEERCREVKQSANVENILSRVRMMVSAAGKSDSLSGLTRQNLLALEESIRRTIAEAVTPELGGVEDDLPHRHLARWLSKAARKTPVEIFTVNYDVLIEHALERERIPVFDGFVGSYLPFFHPDSLRRLEAAPGASWTRLWKMHGSVTWRRVELDGRYRIVRGAPDPDGEMILPSFQKYDESRQQPYVAFTDRLSRFLDQDDALLVVAGFSFGDEHINNLMFGALENRSRAHIYALQFDEEDDQADLVKRACQRPNMIVIGPNTGIIGGRRATWAPSENSSIMAGLLDVKEPSKSEDVASNKKDATMRVGDFSVFCSLLESMAVR